METNNNTVYNTDDVIIEDSENWKNTPLGIKELALRQFYRCQEAGSKPLTPGGVRRILVNGNVEEVMEQDSGTIFCNSVKMLEVTLSNQLRLKKKEMDKEKDYINCKKEYDNLIIEFQNKMNELNKMPEYQKGRINQTSIINKYERKIYQKNIEVHIKLLEKLSILMALHNYFNEEIW